MRIDFILLQHLFRYLLLASLFFLLASFFQVRNSYGQEATISDFTAANSEDNLLLYLTVSDWFTEDMEAAIHNGIPITFVFSIDLSVKKTNGPTRKSASMNSTMSWNMTASKSNTVFIAMKKGTARLPPL